MEIASRFGKVTRSFPNWPSSIHRERAPRSPELFRLWASQFGASQSLNFGAIEAALAQLWATPSTAIKIIIFILFLRNV
jgi:hypothetical protein